MKGSYSEKQIEIANLLHSVGKDGVPVENIDEIIDMLETEQQSLSPRNPAEDDRLMLEIKLLEEKNWVKRAILAAKIISKGLE